MTNYAQIREEKVRYSLPDFLARGWFYILKSDRSWILWVYLGLFILLILGEISVIQEWKERQGYLDFTRLLNWYSLFLPGLWVVYWFSYKGAKEHYSIRQKLEGMVQCLQQAGHVARFYPVPGSELATRFRASATYRRKFHLGNEIYVETGSLQASLFQLHKETAQYASNPSRSAGARGGAGIKSNTVLLIATKNGQEPVWLFDFLVNLKGLVMESAPGLEFRTVTLINLSKAPAHLEAILGDLIEISQEKQAESHSESGHLPQPTANSPQSPTTQPMAEPDTRQINETVEAFLQLIQDYLQGTVTWKMLKEPGNEAFTLIQQHKRALVEHPELLAQIGKKLPDLTCSKPPDRCQLMKWEIMNELEKLKFDFWKVKEDGQETYLEIDPRPEFMTAICQEAVYGWLRQNPSGNLPLEDFIALCYFERLMDIHASGDTSQPGPDLEKYSWVLQKYPAFRRHLLDNVDGLAQMWDGRPHNMAGAARFKELIGGLG
ncbi:MAG: hypothetical protein H6581_11695 [Bacteroidia bacterium]|nr:hypothetical protein [Bacteroidia bacterium]